MAELWMHLTYSKQGDGKIACKITSGPDISFDRNDEAPFDMKVYAARSRVYYMFNAQPGDPIHIDVYDSDGGESTGMEADFKVTEQAVEVVRATSVTVTTSQEQVE